MSRWHPESLEKRFEDRFIPEPNSGCWLWTGELDAYGYGSLLLRKIKENGVWRKMRIKAHQLAWKLHKGEIPDGLEVCHSCDMPQCVNPEHLFVGTHYQNMRDRDIKGRGKNTVTLTAEKVLAIRSALKTEYRPRYIAAALDVSTEAVRCIRDGRSWKHVT